MRARGGPTLDGHYGRGMYDVVSFNISWMYPIVWVLFALALLAVIGCFIVLLLSAAKALKAHARWRTVQTELLLAEALAGGDSVSSDPPTA